MITRVLCTLTGTANALADVVLPASSIRVTHRADTASSFGLVVPGVALAVEIAARPNGQLVVEASEGGAVSELMRGSIYSVRSDLGPTSASLSLSGGVSQASPPAAAHALSGVSYLATTDTGETRLRCAPVAAMRPGDTVTYAGVSYLVDTITWNAKASAGSLQITMELSASATDP